MSITGNPIIVPERKPKKTKKKSIPKRRKWFFTIWKINMDWEELYDDYNDIIKFCAGQLEKAPETGRLHWQGCIHMVNPCRMTKMRRLLGLGKGEESGFLQEQQGTNEQVLEYVHKLRTSEGQRFEYGKPSQQGLRSDLEAIRKRLRDGEKLLSIADDYFGSYIRYGRYFKEYQSLVLQERSKKWRNIKVKFLSGPTRCGKTRYAYDNYDVDDIFKISCSDGLKWFDGYQGQKVLILDEFKNQVQLTRMLDLLDNWQCRLEYKGGITYALWDTVIITTNLRRCQVFPNQPPDLIAPLWSRVQEWVDMWPKCHDATTGNIGTVVPDVETSVSDNSEISEKLTENNLKKFIKFDNVINVKKIYEPIIDFQQDDISMNSADSVFKYSDILDDVL